MEPVTMALIAKGLWDVGSAAYNMYAQDQNAQYEKGIIAKQNRLATQQRQFQIGQVGSQYAQGLQDISNTSGSSMASLAQSSGIGAGTQDIAKAQATDQTAKLTDWRDDALQQIEFNRRSQAIQTETALDRINAQNQASQIGGWMNIGGAILGAGAVVADYQSRLNVNTPQKPVTQYQDTWNAPVSNLRQRIRR